MKDLPLISSDYPAFDWWTDNGEATEEQCYAAWVALNTQGQTADFSRLVWNSLVDKTADCVTAAGEDWDKTYGTVDETKIGEIYGVLTAKRFNAVTYNIEKLIKNKWKWAVNDSVTGFLNRARVYGITERGSKADIVYGWYIIELARVVNLLINIMKDEADLAELECCVSSETNVHSDLTVAKSLPISVHALSASIAIADLYTGPAAHLTVNTTSGTNEHAELTAAKPFPLKGLAISGTNVNADLLAMMPAGLESHVSNGTNVYANLVKNIYSAKMKFQGSIRTNVFAEISFHNGIEILGRAISESITHAPLSKAPPLTMAAHQTSGSSVYAQMKKLESFLLASNAVSGSEICAEIDLTEPVHIYSHSCLKSSVWSKIVLPRVDLLYTMSQSESGASADMLIKEPLQTETHVKSQTSGYAEIRTVEVKHMEGSAVSASAVHAETSLVQPLYVASESDSESSAYAELTVGRPMDLKVEALMQSMSYAEIVNLLPASLVSEVKSGTTVDVDLLRRKAVNMATHATCGTNVYAVLSFWEAEPEETWYDPVQDGSSLYIQCVYSSWREDEKGYIDVAVWYDPKREGNDLYLRSAYQAYSDGNEGFVDMDVYYKPKRTGNNLFITSAESMKGVIDDG